MNNIKDDYLRFDVGGDESDSKSNLFGTIIKALIIILLILLVIVVGSFAYKFLFSSKENTQQVQKIQPISQTTQPIQQNVAVNTQPKKSEDLQTNTNQTNNLKNQITQQVKNNTSGLKKEDIAMIVQAVLAQMEQKQASQASNVNNPAQETQTNVQNSDDSELLNSLQAVSVDRVEKNEIDTSRLENINTNQEVRSSNIKKEDTFNKIIVENQNANTQDDLSKLYSQLNQIMQKDKTKKSVKDKTFVKKLEVETKVRKNEMRIITVKKGDTLSKIALRAYGNPMLFTKIFEANPDLISDPNRIYPGQKLRVPR